MQEVGLKCVIEKHLKVFFILARQVHFGICYQKKMESIKTLTDSSNPKKEKSVIFRYLSIFACFE